MDLIGTGAAGDWAPPPDRGGALSRCRPRTSAGDTQPSRPGTPGWGRWGWLSVH